MNLHVNFEEEKADINVAEAASKAWKKNKRKSFRTGIILAAVLAAIAAGVFFGSHYAQTSAADDTAGLENFLESYSEAEIINVHSIVQKGDYLAVSGCAGDGLWHLGIFARDAVFSNRWRICGSLNKVKPGYLANWNYQTAEGDTILVCFGAELSQDICGYSFTNSGVTYTCTVGENAFWISSIFRMPTIPEPVWNRSAGRRRWHMEKNKYTFYSKGYNRIAGKCVTLSRQCAACNL